MAFAPSAARTTVATTTRPKPAPRVSSTRVRRRRSPRDRGAPSHSTGLATGCVLATRNLPVGDRREPRRPPPSFPQESDHAGEAGARTRNVTCLVLGPAHPGFHSDPLLPVTDARVE